MRSRRRTIHDAKGAQTVNHSALVGLVVAAACVACGGPETVPTATEQPPAVVADAQPDVSVGTVSFSVDGQAKKFDHLPAGHNVHTPLSSSIVARPSADAVEQLTVAFIGINLKSVTYPADLPLPRDPGNVMSAMANVGFSYTSADGIEWAGPGRIHIASFASDGMIAGSFTGVSTPHTEKQRPNIVLADGAFRARISAPW